MSTTERTILGNLINNEQYGRKVIPFIKSDYFGNPSEKIVYELIDEYVGKYNAFPTKGALKIDLSGKEGLGEELFKQAEEVISEIPDQSHDMNNEDWLLDTTERFCQDRAIFNALSEAVRIAGGEDKNLSRTAIPHIMQEALAVSFDTSIGHDFLEDAEKRFEYYHQATERIPFDIEYLNTITGGGIPRKTLTALLAGTGVGKSLVMCHMAAANLTLGKNVLYITLEMAEEKIAERIDANLLDIQMDQLRDLPKSSYETKINRLKEKVLGKLIIKEYPTSCAGANNFRHLLHELKIKKNFVPDVIYIDYLNICSSSRLKQSANVNSYTYVKAIAEEIRGLAVEFNVPIITATQTTRGGYDNSDVSLTDTSESFGLPATVDMMLALIATDDLKQLNQMMFKQLKNRFSDPEMFKKFIVGVDKSRMRLYNVEKSVQNNISDDSASSQDSFGPSKNKMDKNSFDKFK